MVDLDPGLCAERQRYQAERKGTKVLTVVVGSISNGVSAGAGVPGVAVSRAGPVTTDGDVEGY